MTTQTFAKKEEMDAIINNEIKINVIILHIAQALKLKV